MCIISYIKDMFYVFLAVIVHLDTNMAPPAAVSANQQKSHKLSRRKRKILWIMKTLGCCLLICCGFIFVPGIILLGLGFKETGAGEIIVKRYVA